MQRERESERKRLRDRDRDIIFSYVHSTIIQTKRKKQGQKHTEINLKKRDREIQAVLYRDSHNKGRQRKNIYLKHLRS